MTAERRVHSPNGKWTRCGIWTKRSPLVSVDLADVTCRTCRRRAEEDYASKRDGVDYRMRRHEEARGLAADRAAAARTVVLRHQEEYEMELALRRLARRS